MKRSILHYDNGGDADAYEDYYVNQSGYKLPVLHNQRTQRGHGIGNIFGGLFWALFRFIKRRKALQTGIQIANELAEGRSLKEAAKESVGKKDKTNT